MFFFEKQSVSIDRQGQANCPHCGTALTPRNRGMPLRYSGASLTRVLILTAALGILLWLFANSMEGFPLIGGLGENVRDMISAVLCVAIGFLIAYLSELLEIKLLYRRQNQRLHGFHCRFCNTRFAGVQEIRKHKENVE